MRATSFALLCLIGLPAVAHADAVEVPSACPPGALGRSSHAGEWCVPDPCVVDADCAARNRIEEIVFGPIAQHCREWRVCVRTADVPLGGDHGSAPHHAEDIVLSTCAPTEACDGTEEPSPPVIGVFHAGAPVCAVATYCLEDPLPPLPTRPRSPPSAVEAPPAGCACGIARREEVRAPIVMVGLLAIGFFVGRRR